MSRSNRAQRRKSLQESYRLAQLDGEIALPRTQAASNPKESTGASEVKMDAQPPVPSPPSTQRFFALGDSLAILGVIVTAIFWALVPTVLEKGGVLLVAVGGGVYWSYTSHWAKQFPKWKHITAAAWMIIVLGGGGWQLYDQYFKFVPSLSLTASLAPGHQNGVNVGGLKWPSDFRDVRVSIDNISEYSIHKLDITIRTLDKSGDVLGGIGQISDLEAVRFSPPDLPDDRIHLTGADGKRYELSARDMGTAPWGPYWKVFCPRLPTTAQLRLAVAAVHAEGFGVPRKLRLLGSYEIVSQEATKLVNFDKTIDVSQ